MIRKSFLATVLVAVMCVCATPAQAQLKKLGKSLGNAGKEVGKVAQNMATDAAMEMGANKASDKIIEFMDQNNVVSADDSEYTTRLKTILGENFADVEGKPLNIKVYETPEANIITLNNGNIRIYSGMLDLLDNDDEVKALVALQAGHLSSGNIKNNLLKVVSGDNAEGATAAQLEKMMSFSGDKFGSIINELLQVPYTEDQNVEADKVAKKYLKSNGGDSDAFYSLLSKFQDLKYVDLEADDVDEEDETVIQATVAAKFINANSLR